MPIEFNYATNVISITSPDTSVEMQDLANAIGEVESRPENMGYPEITVDIVGKFDKGGGNYSEIIIELESPWQVQFWAGSGVSTIAGGSLLGGLGGVPFKATGAAGDITILSKPVDGTIVVSGSGLSAEEQTKLDELHKLQGLDADNPMTVTPTSRDVGGISQTISGDGETTTTVTRD